MKIQINERTFGTEDYANIQYNIHVVHFDNEI